MKDKKMIVLYILMLIIGFALLFTNNSSSDNKPKLVVQPEPIKQQPLSVKMEYITVAVANRELKKGTIITDKDYSLKSIEVNTLVFDKTRYVTNLSQINAYVTKFNITKDSYIEINFLASPNSQDYVMLTLSEGMYLFPFILEVEDNYILKNLQNGDLIDIYLLYGSESTNRNNTNSEIKLTSPGRDFSETYIKPIMSGKKILFIEESIIPNNNTKNNNAILNIALTNDEIKQLKTLMTNAKVFIFPSILSEDPDEKFSPLFDKERQWPVLNQGIFNKTKINRLRGY